MVLNFFLRYRWSHNTLAENEISRDHEVNGKVSEVLGEESDMLQASLLDEKVLMSLEYGDPILESALKEIDVLENLCRWCSFYISFIRRWYF